VRGRPWPTFVTERLGYAEALAATRTRRLFSHEYGMIFYLGERVMRQHSPELPIRIPAWPPVWMRQVSSLPIVEVPALIDGIPFEGLVREGDYAVFADRYLMREQKGVRGCTFYERYTALGGDPTFIRGQLYLSRRLPGYTAPPPNRRAKGIADSDDEDPDGERVQAPAVEEEEEGSEEVPLGQGENIPAAGTTTPVPTAPVETERVAGVGSSTVIPSPTVMSQGRGRGTPSASTPRTPTIPTLSEMDWNSAEMRQMLEQMWLPEAQRSGSVPSPNFDWTQHVSLSRLQTPRATFVDSPSVNTRPWTVSPPTSVVAPGITIRDMSDFESMLQSDIARRQPVVDTGDKGKAPATEPSQARDSDDDITLPPPPMTAGTGASGAGPSGAPPSFSVPDLPQDIIYYEGIRPVMYRVPTVPLEAVTFGPLAGVPPETVSGV